MKVRVIIDVDFPDSFPEDTCFGDLKDSVEDMIEDEDMLGHGVYGRHQYEYTVRFESDK